MKGTAFLDDSIWPRYAAEYNAIPVLSSGYPSETQIRDVNADFIMGNFNSAFEELRVDENGRTRGIFSNATLGRRCEGENSDFFPAGSNVTISYSRCRPQLHQVGIGTWLEPTYCEDIALRPKTATEETVRGVITQLGAIFNVSSVATELTSQIASDFLTAQQTVQSSGHARTAILYDSSGCGGTSAACASGGDGCKLFVGAGGGLVNLILNASGLTNHFAHKEGSYACVDPSEVYDAEPDVLIIVNSSWDTFYEKIDFLHSNSNFCNKRFVKQANYIGIPFSASVLGPRIGAAVLDLVSAVFHMNNGSTTLDFQSGVTFADSNMLVHRTADLLCPLYLTDNSSGAVASPPPPSPPTLSPHDCPNDCVSSKARQWRQLLFGSTPVNCPTGCFRA